MQANFGMNMVAIVDVRHTFNLEANAAILLDPPRRCCNSQTRFELAKAEARAHILEGLRIALDNIDEIVHIIRNSQSSDIARKQL